jgi:hypothetical protein
LIGGAPVAQAAEHARPAKIPAVAYSTAAIVALKDHNIAWKLAARIRVNAACWAAGVHRCQG